VRDQLRGSLMQRRQFMAGLGSAAAGPARAQQTAPHETVAARAASLKQYRMIPLIGHDVPQEGPGAFPEAILELIAARRAD
jgi:pimeloyl-ACP methyl ester carboxylesterase